MKLAAFLAAAICLAQTPAAFEAAAIKPADPNQRGSGIRTDHARIRVINSTIKFLVQFAWNVKEFQVSGGPSWANNERFDIDAVAAKPFEEGELKAMLQTLLAERFGVAVHLETQEKPGYALVVAKNGPKLPPPIEDRNIMFDHTATGDVTFTAKNITMAQFASALSSQLTAIVVDHTGVEGRYDCSLQWTPDRPLVSKSGEPLPPADAMPGPSIFTAVQEKLGLRLESRKVPTEIVVIDRADHPTAN